MTSVIAETTHVSTTLVQKVKKGERNYRHHKPRSAPRSAHFASLLQVCIQDATAGRY